ncbi:MAG: PLP-dependent transferase [Acidimicrobiales bacterium]
MNLASRATTSSPRLRSTGTYNLLHYTLPKMGITCTFVEDPDDDAEWQAAVQDNTKAFYCESIGNPKNNVVDIRKVADIAHANNVPLIVDNTVATPFLIRPIRARRRHRRALRHQVHRRPRHRDRRGDRRRRHLRLRRIGQTPHVHRARPQLPRPSRTGPHSARAPTSSRPGVQLLRDIGGDLAVPRVPAPAGLETLSLRMEPLRQRTEGGRVPRCPRPGPSRSPTAGLPSSPWHATAGALTGGAGYGSVPAFEIKGGLEAGRKFVEALELHSHLANIGDVRSLVIQPAATTHSQLTPEEQASTGVTPGWSGCRSASEHVDDIIADLEKGFAAAR